MLLMSDTTVGRNEHQLRPTLRWRSHWSPSLSGVAGSWCTQAWVSIAEP